MTVISTFRALRDLTPASVGATVPDLENGPAWLHFTTEAQHMFDAWRQKLETSLRGGDRHPALESHLAKYRSLIPALALITHLAGGGLGPVDKAALMKAIRWGDYLFKHARRVYASATNSAGFSAKALADKIKAGKVADGFTIRQIYRNGWASLNDADEVLHAAEWLTENGWLRPVTIDTGGRKTTAYTINPKAKQ